MKVAVISACYGGYDAPKPPVAQNTEHEVTFTMVTDGPTWDGWRTIVEPRPHLHNNVAAKVPKCRPDLYAPEGTEYTVWIDAGATFENSLVRMVLDVYNINGSPVVSIPHPPTHHIDGEVLGSRVMHKYAPLPLEQQMAHYLAEGFPSDSTIWTTGLLGRPINPAMSEIGSAWLTEIARWGFQDQLSHPYVLWKYNVQPSAFPLDAVYFLPHIQKPF